MSKQTAIEWLVEQMNIKNPNWLKEEIEQAKEMEKQQLIQAAYDNMNATEEDPMQDAIEYYNETFKK